MKLSFSLNAGKPKPAVGSAPLLKKPTAFSSLDDDEPIDGASAPSSSRKHIPQNVGPSKATRKRLEAEMQMDQSLFDYDEHWEKIQETREKQKQAKEADAKVRKVSFESHKAILEYV